MNSLKLVPEHAKKVISAFLAQGDELGQDPMSVSAPQANAYEFQSQVRLCFLNESFVLNT